MGCVREVKGGNCAGSSISSILKKCSSLLLLVDFFEEPKHTFVSFYPTLFKKEEILFFFFFFGKQRFSHVRLLFHCRKFLFLVIENLKGQDRLLTCIDSS